VFELQIDRRISIDVSDEIKRLVPILGKEKASRLETAYLLADEETRRRILEMIDALKAAVFSDKDLKSAVLMEPPSKELVSNGEIEFGTVLYGKKRLYPLFLDREMLLSHIGIFGSSGYGKTNIAHWLITVLAEKGIPVLVFDFSKRNYRDLLSIPELKDKIDVYTVGRNVSPFRFNPLRPPEGVQISQWAKEFSEVFDHAYWMMGGGRHIILKALGVLYESFKPNVPRIKDLRDWLEKYRLRQTSSRERNWIATAERPLESLCFYETGDVFDCDEGILPSRFFEDGKVTILELDSLSANDKVFFIEIMLQWIRDAALVSGKREKLRGVIILEEAHHVLNREKSKRLGTETVIDLIFREVRELGIGMVYIDQHPSLISYPALGNTSTHIYMNLGLDTKYSSDILDASNMLGLKYEEEGDYLRRLPVGHAFILMRRLAFPRPFLVGFPLVKIEKGSVTDELVKEFMQGKLAEEIRKVRELKVKQEMIQKPIEEVEEKIQRIDNTSWRIIEVLGNGAGSSTSEIYNSLRISGSSFKKRAEKLIKLGLIGFCVGKVYKQKANYYFLTEKGERTFESKFERRFEEMEIDVEEAKNFLMDRFILEGWKLTEDRPHQLVFEKKGKKIFINLAFRTSIEEIERTIEKSEKNESYFVCTSERIKNLITQRVARHSQDHKIGIILFITTIRELKEGNDFRRIEFIPDNST
jgi:DNA helicase HerA-like ATPase/DNA-binding MarR family transcriptional regulator